MRSELKEKFEAWIKDIPTEIDFKPVGKLLQQWKAIKPTEVDILKKARKSSRTDLINQIHDILLQKQDSVLETFVKAMEEVGTMNDELQRLVNMLPEPEKTKFTQLLSSAGEAAAPPPPPPAYG